MIDQEYLKDLAERNDVTAKQIIEAILILDHRRPFAPGKHNISFDKNGSGSVTSFYTGPKILFKFDNLKELVDRVQQIEWEFEGEKAPIITTEPSSNLALRLEIDRLKEYLTEIRKRLANNKVQSETHKLGVDARRNVLWAHACTVMALNQKTILSEYLKDDLPCG